MYQNRIQKLHHVLNCLSQHRLSIQIGHNVFTNLIIYVSHRNAQFVFILSIGPYYRFSRLSSASVFHFRFLLRFYYLRISLFCLYDFTSFRSCALRILRPYLSELQKFVLISLSPFLIVLLISPFSMPFLPLIYMRSI